MFERGLWGMEGELAALAGTKRCLLLLDDDKFTRN